jgi:hypothetical protein
MILHLAHGLGVPPGALLDGLLDGAGNGGDA